MSRTQKAIAALVALVAVVVAFVALRPSDDGDEQPPVAPAATATQPATDTTPAPPRTTATTPPKPTVTTIAVRDGAPVGGAKTVTVKSGETVRLRFTSNAEDDIHVHGYDLEKTVPANGSVTFTFKATNEGVFDIEAHSTDSEIAKLEVVP